MTLLPQNSTLLLPFRGTPPNGAPALNVGVVVDDTPPAPWVDALIAFLQQLPGTEVRPHALSSSPPQRRGAPWLTDRLYSASRSKFDPFGDIPAHRTESPTPESLSRLETASYDTLIWLSTCRNPQLNLGRFAKHGVFTVHFGGQNQAIPFWDEVADNQPTSSTIVYWHDTSFSLGRAVRTAETSTFQGLFVTRNAEEPVTATIRMLAGLCLEIRHDSRQFVESMRGLVNQSLPTALPASLPTNIEAGRFAASKLARSLQLRWKARGKRTSWFIALRRNCGGSITDPERLDLAGFQALPLSPGSELVADPFLYDVDGRSYLLFEEIAAGSARGRLAAVEIAEDGSYSDRRIVLQRDYHLSYPCVAAYAGELFLLPETSEIGRVDLYRFSHFPWEVELVSSLFEGLALTDTTPICIDGLWYFFTTTVQPFMETLLFSSDRLDGAWALHPCSPVSGSVKNSRSAGNLFWKNGRLYRPTQDCSVRYGYAIRVNEVVRLTPTEFEEREVSRIPPVWTPGLLGTHTWNQSSRWQVIDGLRWFPGSGRNADGHAKGGSGVEDSSSC